MKKNDGILLGQPGEHMEMLFFNTYEGTVNIKALTHHLFYILDGTVTLLYQAKKYTLSTDDIFFIPLEEVIILSTSYCHTLALAIPPARFPDSNPHIYCNSAFYPNSHYNGLRRLLARLLPILSSSSHYGKEDTKKAFRDISTFLTKYFYAAETPEASLQPEALPLSQNKHQIFLQDVLREINTSYTKRITLSSLAKKYYVSTSYLSKLFLKETGLHFNDYILNLRLSDALSQVIFSSYPLSEIAHRSGFPDTRSLHDTFSKANGIGPAEYRKQLRKQADNTEETAHSVQHLTEQGYFQHLLQYLNMTSSTDTTTVTLSHSLPPATPSINFKNQIAEAFELCLPDTSVSDIRQHFSVSLTDWTLLQTEAFRNMLRRLNSETVLDSLAIPLPDSHSLQASLYQTLFLTADFFYEEHLSVFLLSSSISQTNESFHTAYSTKLKDYLNKRFQNQVFVFYQTEQYYLEHYIQILPYSTTTTLLHDSWFHASFLLHQLTSLFLAKISPKQHPIKCLNTAPVSICYHYATLSDLCPPSLDITKTFTGKAGLFTANGIAKPAFYAFSFFSQIGSELLYQQDGILIGRVQTRIQILFYQAPLPEAHIPQYLPDTAALLGFYHSCPKRNYSVQIHNFSYSCALLTEKRLSPYNGSGFEGCPLELLQVLPYELEKHLEPVPLFRKRLLPVYQDTLLLECELLPYEICLLELEGYSLAI